MLFKWITEEKKVIIKETNAILQLEMIKSIMPDFHFVHLRRNPAAVLESHMRIPNVIEEWHYLSRIERFRKATPKYGEIYERADKEILYGSKCWSLLFAHLVVQTLILGDEIKDCVIYEDLVKYGLGTQSLHNTLNLGLIENFDALSLDNQEKKKYKLHGTKNPTDPFIWLDRFFKEDFKVMRKILRQYKNLVFIDKSYKEKSGTKIPRISYVANSMSFLPLTNRTITSGEYVKFLNDLVRNGIENPHKLLCVSNSVHTMNRIEKMYFAKKPNRPLVLVSPIGALAFCCCFGGKLPCKNSYDEISSVITREVIADPNIEKNYAENVGSVTVPGNYTNILGYYDVVGNTRELAIDDNGNFFVVGGSFKDELDDLLLSKQQKIPAMYRDLDIGFRIQFNNHKMSITQMVSLLNSSNDHLELVNSLLRFISIGSI